jgi:hypothetical protein
MGAKGKEHHHYPSRVNPSLYASMTLHFTVVQARKT